MSFMFSRVVLTGSVIAANVLIGYLAVRAGTTYGGICYDLLSAVGASGCVETSSSIDWGLTQVVVFALMALSLSFLGLYLLRGSRRWLVATLVLAIGFVVLPGRFRCTCSATELPRLLTPGTANHLRRSQQRRRQSGVCRREQHATTAAFRTRSTSSPVRSTRSSTSAGLTPDLPSSGDALRAAARRLRHSAIVAPMGLQTPWLRDQLRVHLRSLGDEQWVAAELGRNFRPGVALGEVLDFLDDTGVVDVPEGRIGYVLLEAHEAAAMRHIGSVLNAALDEPTRERWQQVAAAARSGLAALK
jgi:hypothetical protein